MLSSIYIISSNVQNCRLRLVPRTLPDQTEAVRCGCFAHSPAGMHSDTQVGPAWTCSPALTSCPEPHDSKTISQMQVVVESVGCGGKSPQECSFALGSLISILESLVSSCQTEFCKQTGRAGLPRAAHGDRADHHHWCEVRGNFSLLWQTFYCRK